MRRNRVDLPRSAEEMLVKEGYLSEIRQGLPTRVIAVPSTASTTAEIRARLRKVRDEIDDVLRMLETADK